jgi:hypothetical protein
VRRCPHCQGPMRVLEFLTAKQLYSEQVRQVVTLDSS